METTNDLWSGSNPWLGLRTYSEGRKLYGRNNEIASLTDMIQNNVAVVLFGKSGIGKSSLLKAGVSPELRRKEMFPVHIRLEHNTSENYTEQIEKKVCGEIIVKERLPEQSEKQSLWEFFHGNDFYDNQGNEVRPVVVLDQFEETYTLTDNEHKQEVQRFFTELADLLNDVVPDSVTERSDEDLSHVIGGSDENKEFSITLNRNLSELYKNEMAFHFVICLREDYLYFLELNSRKIPALKVNRYRLHAFDVESAKDVILSPRPGLIDDATADAIIKRIGVVQEDNEMSIDPTILSIYMYKYFNKKGNTGADNIIAEYYADETANIRVSSMRFFESRLITGEGFRHHIPYNDAISAGVKESEIDMLLACRILTKEPHKGHDYIEFSHDVLCPIAKEHRDDRLLKIRKHKIASWFLLPVAVFLVLFLGYWANWYIHIKQRLQPISVVVGGGSAANYISLNYFDIALSKDSTYKKVSKNSREWFYIHMPTGESFHILAEEFIAYEDEETKHYYPFCVAASQATDSCFMLNGANIDEIGRVIEYNFGTDSMYVYVHNEPKMDTLIHNKDFITLGELRNMISNRDSLKLTIHATSKSSGTRNAYRELLGCDDDKVNLNKIEPDHYADNSNDSIFKGKPSYVVLGTEYYYPFILADSIKNGRCRKLLLVDDADGNKACYKDLYVYFIAYRKKGGNATILAVPKPTQNILEKMQIKNYKDKVRDGKVRINPKHKGVIYRFEDLRDWK